MAETPFTIAVPDAAVSRLHAKLADTTFPEEIEGDEVWTGAPSKDVQRLVKHWQSGFDWRKTEAALNAELPQFTRDIAVEDFGTLKIHYVHKKSVVEGAIPLLIVHGWPGSFIEVRKILPLLTEPSPEKNHPSFHVVAISLPGTGFSQGPKKAGFAIDQHAEVAHKLMLALGYNEYVVQGGDWGKVVTRRVAMKYGPTHVKAWHTNFPGGSPGGLGILKMMFSPSVAKATIRGLLGFVGTKAGYMSQFATRPQTVAYGFADSPVTLLANVYEKMVEWSDGYEWTDDDVLTWVSIHWFSTAGPAAAIRIYHEASGGNFRAAVTQFTDTEKPSPPFGSSHFTKEILVFPPSWAGRSGNMVFQKVHDKGGHFPSWEVPEVLVDDLRVMFGKGSKAFGVVKGHDGY